MIAIYFKAFNDIKLQFKFLVYENYNTFDVDTYNAILKYIAVVPWKLRSKSMFADSIEKFWFMQIASHYQDAKLNYYRLLPTIAIANRSSNKKFIKSGFSHKNWTRVSYSIKSFTWNRKLIMVKCKACDTIKGQTAYLTNDAHI